MLARRPTGQLQHETQRAGAHEMDRWAAGRDADRSEQRFRTLAMSAPVGIFVTDLAGKCVYVNRRWCELTGLSSAEAAGDGWARALHPADREEISRAWYEAATADVPFELEYRFCTPQGKTLWVSGRSTAVREVGSDGQSRIVEHIGTVTDITDSKEAESRLSESERKLGTLLQNLQGMAYRCLDDADWTMQFVSQGCRELTGYQASSLIGNRELTYNDLIHPDDRQAVATAVSAALSQDRPFRIEYRLCTASGQQKWVSEQGVGVPVPQGGGRVIEGYISDINDLVCADEAYRRLNQELEHRVVERTSQLRDANGALQESLTALKVAQQRLIQSERMAALGELVAGVAHEINTPVGVGLTAASFLEERTERLAGQFAAQRMQRSDFEGYLGTASEACASIVSNLRRAADLVRSFKQVAVDRTNEQQRPFLLHDYIHTVLRSLGPKIKRSGHSVTVRCPQDLLINSFPGAFSHLITNMIMNSLVHGFDGISGGQIVIDASAEGATLLLRYNDNGCGMDAECVKRVFDPFFTTKRAQDSTGLGMHVVYNVVTQVLGGSIECRSGAGQGATFVVRVPLEQHAGA